MTARYALLALLLPCAAAAQPTLDWEYVHRPDVLESSSVGDLVVDADGNTYVVGTYIDSAGGATTLSDVIVLKLDPEGDVLWEDVAVLSGSWDEGYTLTLDGQGHLYVAGNRAEDHLHLRKYTTDGALIWEKTFAERLAEPDPCYLALAPDGTLVVALTTMTPGSGFGDDIWVLKVSPAGVKLWEHLYQGVGGGLVQNPRAVAVHTDGTIAVAGRSTEDLSDGANALVYTLSAAGAFQWQRTVDGTDLGSNWFNDVAFGPDGSLYVTGHVLHAATAADVLTEKLTPGGAVVWSRLFDNPEASDYDYAYDLALADDGAVYVTGETGYGVFTDRYFDVLTIGYRPDGTVAWWDPIDSGDPSRDNGTEIALDASGRVVVQGVIKANPGNDFVSVTALYTPDGERLWTDAGDLDTDEAAGFDLAVSGDRILIGGLADTGPGAEHLYVAQYHNPAPAVSVAVEPVGGPVVIGPGGGSFQFTATLTNAGSQPLTFDAWTEVTGPVNRGPVLGPLPVTLAPGATLTRTLTQRVPANAPPGVYTYTGTVGTFPDGALASDSFPVTKQGAAARGGAAEGWAVSGWSVSGVERWDEGAAAASALPGAFALSEAAPNPSRGRARFTLALPAPERVTVAVYDGLGRRVALLHDGPMEAGTYALAFDGTGLPGGVYVVRAAGETASATHRLTLVR
jgi:hypothetical protein